MLKPNKYIFIIFGLFLVLLSLPPVNILLDTRIPFTGFLILVSVFFWYFPVAIFSSLGLNVFKPCLEECLSREPNQLGLAITIIFNLIFFYFISSLIGTAIKKKINKENADQKPFVV